MTWKQTAMRGLPRPMVHWLRKQYYPGVVRRFDESRWPCAPVVKKLLQPGDVVIDVGANIGYITYLLAQWVGPQGHVHAVEPVPATFGLLQHNVSRLNCSQVTLYNVGVSSQPGQALMEIPNYEGGGENLYESRVVVADAVTETSHRTVQVELQTLDDLFYDSNSPVHCIKMDVEGHELSAVRGGIRLLETWHPALVIEVSGDPDAPGSDAEELFKILADTGYGAYVLEGETLRSRVTGDVRVDYFFLQSCHEDICDTVH